MPRRHDEHYQSNENCTMTLKSYMALGGILIGIGGAVESAAILPYRVSQAEKATEILSNKVNFDHDLLIQISRDIQYVREKLQENRNRP